MSKHLKCNWTFRFPKTNKIFYLLYNKSLLCICLCPLHDEPSKQVPLSSLSRTADLRKYPSYLNALDLVFSIHET